MASAGKTLQFTKGSKKTGNRGNIKVTTPVDVYMFRALLSYKENEQAFGFGLTDKMRSKINYYKRDKEE